MLIDPIILCLGTVQSAIGRAAIDGVRGFRAPRSYITLFNIIRGWVVLRVSFACYIMQRGTENLQATQCCADTLRILSCFHLKAIECLMGKVDFSGCKLKT